MTKRFVAACIQLGNGAGHAYTRKEMKKHMDYVCNMIDWAVAQYCLCAPLGVKLIIGPELSIYGWQSLSLRELHDKYAIEIPGEETQRLIAKAKEYNCYISPGTFIERDPESCKHLIFNTQVLVGPEGISYRYRKVQPWWPLEPSVSPHDLLSAGYDIKKNPLFPVVKTEIGNVGGFICYDCYFPEVARQLALNGCEIFLGSTAEVDPWGRPPLDNWTTCSRARSIENMAYGVYCATGCTVSNLHSFSGSGGSLIVDFEGRILAQSSGPTESLTMAVLDIDALRDHRKHSRLNNYLAQLRVEAYDYLRAKKCWTPQAQLKDKEDLNLDEADEINCKETERFWSRYYDEKVTVPRWRPPAWKSK